MATQHEYDAVYQAVKVQVDKMAGFYASMIPQQDVKDLAKVAVDTLDEFRKTGKVVLPKHVSSESNDPNDPNYRP